MTARQPAIKIASLYRHADLSPADARLFQTLRQEFASTDAGASKTWPSVFAVAMRGSEQIGKIGLADPDRRMRPYVSTERPAQLIGAFVTESARRTGWGSRLLHEIETVAIELGSTELLVNDGPNCTASSQAFLTYQYGSPFATAENYYGPHYDVQVWKHVFEPAFIES